jgi:hypoxanthine phosphoribosyltransferase
MIKYIPPSLAEASVEEAPWKGLQTDRKPNFISYDQVERFVGSLLTDVMLWQPEAVVAIVRGGLVPGTMTSCMLALPLFMVSWDRTTDVTGWIGQRPDARRVLLVDDCCATGRTMASVRASLLARAYDCRSMTVLHDPETTRYVPDYSHPMTALFRFPWERGEATPAARRMRATGAPADRSTERPFFGVDLDAVFPPDISVVQNDIGLTEATRPWHVSWLHKVLSPCLRERAVVITEHAEVDRVSALAWLAQWGFQDLALECRPDDMAENIVSVAGYKTATATRWGCTHFIGSDPEQAIRIAAAAPHLVVLWWPAAERRPWVIGAAAQLVAPGPAPEKIRSGSLGDLSGRASIASCAGGQRAIFDGG